MEPQERADPFPELTQLYPTLQLKVAFSFQSH